MLHSVSIVDIMYEANGIKRHIIVIYATKKGLVSCVRERRIQSLGLIHWIMVGVPITRTRQLTPEALNRRRP